MIKLSDFIKNNRLDYILERKNFVQEEELKKKYSKEAEPSGLMLVILALRQKIDYICT